MFRKHCLVTKGYDRILLVCNGGMGIRKFKIIGKGDNAIEVIFELVKKKNVPIIKRYDDTVDVKEIKQTYYIVDLITNQLIRASKIGFNTEFTLNTRKTMILFGLYTDIEPVIKKEKNKFKVKSSNEIVDINFYWLDEKIMPGAIFAIDFEKEIVQRVQQVIFLN